MGLTAYKKKRDFKSTPEPAGKKTTSRKKLEFVVQRHLASRLHYDFRLEMEGVMKSWAIPKGPSLNPKDKRLAIQVEDHPYDYRTFEGIIPEGNYGAGTVEIWDKGTYTAINVKGKSAEKELLKELKAGSLKFSMDGKYLKGEFALVKLKNAEEQNAWLLIKHRDEHAVDDTYNSEDHTSLTKLKGKTMDKKKKNKSPTSKRTTIAKKSVASTLSKKKHLSKYVRPMLAKLVNDAFDSEEWLFEIKWDGYRAIAETGKGLRFYSRNGISFIDQYPDITAALKKIRRRLVIDGEIVALDDKGRAGFQLLQNFDPSESALAYYVFDILSTGNRDLTELPLVDRKDILKKSLAFNEVVRYSDHIIGEGKQFFKLIRKQKIEGIIAKKSDSPYESGLRTGNWLKIKNTAGQEAVIAGFTEPRKSRKFFGSLILGVYRSGKLIYAGHTGTGFNDQSLRELHEQLVPLITAECPFNVTPKTNMPATWVEPRLVCNVKFSEITRDGIMRHPVFVGLRIDKAPQEVGNEKPVVMKKTRTRPKAPAKKKRVSNVPAKTKESTRSATQEWDDGDAEITLDGKQVALTNQKKVFFPSEKITKGDIVTYYQDIASFILPYLKDRPQSLFRTPNGILDTGFFHKDVGDTSPAWVKSKSIYSDSSKKEINYIICNNRATLAYINNLGCIEINPWHSRLSSLDKPDYIAIDIDPSSSNTFDQVIETALAVKEVFDRAGAQCFCKTSGATGLHVYAPVGARYNYDQIKDFAQLLAVMTHELVPDFTSLVRPLKARGKKIYIDFLQNRRGQTLASVYCARPKPGAPVSTPLDWKEVKKGLHPSQFTIKNIGTRLKKKGDLFKGVLGKGLDLKKCLNQLEKS